MKCWSINRVEKMEEDRNVYGTFYTCKDHKPVSSKKISFKKSPYSYTYPDAFISAEEEETHESA